MSKKTFYVTTPIYYPSGKLHIGHAYTTVLADILKRYKAKSGYETYFLTGSDEHGQKIEQKAKEAGLYPKEYVDQIVVNFKKLWSLLDINYDQFIRTTDKFHKKAVEEIFTELLEKDLIYPSVYTGKYCVSCEEFLSKEQMNENFIHSVCLNKATDFSEETYMLRVSKFKDFLNDLLKSDFLFPENRRQEMLNNFVNNDLEDLSVTRISFSWGVKIKENPKHIIYVWLDALSNYITALGFKSQDDSLMKKFWNKNTEILQIIGKEITRFHSIYWPVILKSLDLRMPTKILSHGWILSKDTKMSKSLGNIVDPIELIDKFGSDVLRFFISYELPTYKDGSYSEELLISSYNTNLANNVGNLISRTSNMIIKYFDGELKKENLDKNIFLNNINKKIYDYQKEMDAYNISDAIKIALSIGDECNKLIESSQPWNMEKENKIKELNELLFLIRKCILIMIELLSPILVKNRDRMIEQFGLKDITLENILNDTLSFKKIVDKKIIFERIK